MCTTSKNMCTYMYTIYITSSIAQQAANCHGNLYTDFLGCVKRWVTMEAWQPRRWPDPTSPKAYGHFHPGRSHCHLRCCFCAWCLSLGSFLFLQEFVASEIDRNTEHGVKCVHFKHLYDLDSLESEKSDVDPRIPTNKYHLDRLYTYDIDICTYIYTH